jgi:tetratricopeptide (TPR) repeat protein
MGHPVYRQEPALSLPDPILLQSAAPAASALPLSPTSSVEHMEPVVPAEPTEPAESMESGQPAPQANSEQSQAAVFDDELDSLYYQATFLQRVGKLDEAKVLYQQIQERIGGGQADKTASKSAADEAHRRIAEARDRARARARVKKMSLGPNGRKRCEAAHRKALELFDAGKLQESIPHFVNVLGLDPRHAAAAANLGNAYYGCGKRDLALEWLQLALLLNPRQRAALNGMGLCVAMMGQAGESLEYFDKALAVDPHYASAYSNKGVSLVKLGRLDEALECYDRAVELDPEFDKAYENRGRLHARSKRFSEALADLETLERLVPGKDQLEMGVALEGLGRLSEAIACYDRQIESGRRLAHAYFNKSGALKAQGRYAEAVDTLRQAMQESPDQPMAYWNMSLLLLTLGEYELGWELYEWRWKRNDFRVKERPMARPMWRGEDLAGKTLLITEEQGLGDLIQFSRYARLACERGATVYLEAHRPLAGLMQTLHPSIHILTKGPGQPLPQFDFYCPITSLPLAFGTRVDTIPAYDSYLTVEPARLRAWRERLGPSDKLRVGVVWSGNAKHVNDANRSLPLQELAGLFELDAEFHCLQKEFRRGDFHRLRSYSNVRTWDALLGDFMDTAALASAMDVIVSVDTSVAHLAAAIGKPTWVLLPFVPDFRWLLDRGDSPWYPSVRLFRQPTGKDWTTVIAAVRDTLRAAMSEAPPA